jgi:ABC-type antimicrobial peptide transport system permease subunit
MQIKLVYIYILFEEMFLCSPNYFLQQFFINPLKPNGNYMSHLLQQSKTLLFCIYGFRMILIVNSNYFLKQR